MNNYTLESFISFCDDMMIAEEGKIFDTIKSKAKRFIDQGNDRYYKTHPNKKPNVTKSAKTSSRSELTSTEVESLPYVHNLGKKAEAIILAFFKKYEKTTDKVNARISTDYVKENNPVWIYDTGGESEEVDESIYRNIKDLYDKLEKLEKEEMENIKKHNIELAWFQSDGMFTFTIRFLKTSQNASDKL